MTRTEHLSRVFTAALLAGGLVLAAFGIAAGVAQINVDTSFSAFDPQPEPPVRPGRIDPGSIRGFNPQPEPPTKLTTSGIAIGR